MNSTLGGAAAAADTHDRQFTILLFLVRVVAALFQAAAPAAQFWRESMRECTSIDRRLQLSVHSCTTAAERGGNEWPDRPAAENTEYTESQG